MKKKVIFIITIIAIVLCGCTKRKEDADSGSISEMTEDTHEEEVLFAELLPNYGEHFSRGEEMIIDSDGGDMYCVRISDVEKSEYIKYRNECKKKGFEQVRFETDSTFEARTNDERYYVSVQYWIESDTDSSKNSVNITCGIVKEQ